MLVHTIRMCVTMRVLPQSLLRLNSRLRARAFVLQRLASTRQFLHLGLTTWLGRGGEHGWCRVTLGRAAATL